MNTPTLAELVTEAWALNDRIQAFGSSNPAASHASFREARKLVTRIPNALMEADTAREFQTELRKRLPLL